MLEIDVVTAESYDETSGEFVRTTFRVRLEHSLVSASKWESFWKEGFLNNKEKTPQQTLSYIKFMILNPELPPEVFLNLVANHLTEIQAYISDEMTATKIHTDSKGPQSREVVTTELIYYWMISLGVPVEFEHWHLNRLITLIRTINVKNTPKQKMTLAQRRELNNKRLAEWNTRG